MSIADYQPPKASIALPGGSSFEVRGISLPDVSVLWRFHAETIEALFVKIKAYQGREWSDFLTLNLIAELVDESPILIATIIALAADEFEMLDKVRHFPVPVMVEAIRQIAVLTFDDASGPGKMLAGVLDLIGGFIPTAETLTPAKIAEAA